MKIEPTDIEVIIDTDGNVSTVYDETIDLTDIGEASIRRASHVEPTTAGLWTADLSPVNGPVLGPFTRRSDAINAEVIWLRSWLCRERSSHLACMTPRTCLG